MYLYLALALLGLLYTYLEAKLCVVRRDTIYSKKIPPEFDGFVIVFISDLHIQSPSSGRLARVVKKVNRLNPDIVLLGGDYSNRTTRDIEGCLAPLSGLKAKAYGVLGNHDFEGDMPVKTPPALKKAGVTAIDNKAFWIHRGDARIKIGGVDDWWNGYPWLEPLVCDVKENDFTVLVSHNPDFFEVFPLDQVSLGFSGHNHGGQCNFFGIYAPFLPSMYGLKYRSGRKRIGDTEIICSNGIGTSHFPLRFMAVPQINRVELRRERENGEA